MRLISPAGGALTPGPVTLGIELPEAEPGIRPVSVDLVSPTMPMHGISRFPVQAHPPGRWSARVEIPMEGRWAVYVNLDEGDDAAAFDLSVEGDGHHHGSGGATGEAPHRH